MSNRTTQSSISKPRKRAADVRPEWLLRFGMVVTNRDPQTSRASAVTCSFCLSFGRESNRFQAVKVFRPSFRTENFQKHVRDQHPLRWAQYQACERANDRDEFFKVEFPYAHTMFPTMVSKTMESRLSFPMISLSASSRSSIPKTSSTTVFRRSSRRIPRATSMSYLSRRAGFFESSPINSP